MWTVQMTANMFDMSMFDRKEALQMTRASIRGPAGALDRKPHAFNRLRLVCGAITSVRMCILPHRSYAYKPRAELAALLGRRSLGTVGCEPADLQCNSDVQLPYRLSNR